jgi:hypothetical protein
MAGPTVAGGLRTRPSERSCLPTFLIIGAMKSGTTSLSRYLASHPEIYVVTTPPEPNFFASVASSPWSHVGTWGRGLGWYRSLFAAGAECTHRGEKSVYYAMAPQVPDVPKRMAAVLPAARLVYVVRDPIDRIASHYRQWVDKGYETRPLAQAVLEDPRYVDWSRYAFQIQQYLAYFDREQLLIVLADDLRNRRHETLTRVLAFIDATPDPLLVDSSRELNLGRDKRRSNRGWTTARAALARSGVLPLIPKRVKRRARRMLNRRRVDDRLPPAVAHDLRERLKPDRYRLEELLGRSLETWGPA